MPRAHLSGLNFIRPGMNFQVQNGCLRMFYITDVKRVVYEK